MNSKGNNLDGIIPMRVLPLESQQDLQLLPKRLFSFRILHRNFHKGVQF